MTLFEKLLDFGTAKMELVPKPIIKYPTVHKNDWPVMDVLNLRSWHAVIAGGAAIKWYRGLPVGLHDIDVYCASARRVELAVEHLNSKAICVHRSQYATTYDVCIGDAVWKVQVIAAPQPSINDMFDHFDIPACRIATDGSQWWWGPQFHQDHKTSTLRLTKFHKGSLRRYVKYVNYGYTPVPGLMQQILEHPDVCTNFHDNTDDDGYGDL